ncbi:hypothetical protein R6Z07F_019033 [Ovis aries]
MQVEPLEKESRQKRSIPSKLVLRITARSLEEKHHEHEISHHTKEAECLERGTERHRRPTKNLKHREASGGGAVRRRAVTPRQGRKERSGGLGGGGNQAVAAAPADWKPRRQKTQSLPREPASRVASGRHV